MIIGYIYKATYKMIGKAMECLDLLRTICIFKGNGVHYSSFHTHGVPFVSVAFGGGNFKIGKNFVMNNDIKGNPIGCYERCTFFVDHGATLTIGDNVGISQAALVAIADITIGDNVKIGGGVQVFTSDFHALDPKVRASRDDMKYRKSTSVVIGDNAFIGARSMILKGVTIGENAVIGAGSVVTRSVPANEIWAGNPAKLIRKIE